jgi:hypothetical protein
MACPAAVLLEAFSAANTCSMHSSCAQQSPFSVTAAVMIMTQSALQLWMCKLLPVCVTCYGIECKWLMCKSVNLCRFTGNLPPAWGNLGSAIRGRPPTSNKATELAFLTIIVRFAENQVRTHLNAQSHVFSFSG